MKEIHLLILWSKASNKKVDILEDLNKKFDVLDIYNVAWSQDKFSENLSRFYGENLPKNSGKEKHCGNGTFTCIVVRDNNPIYAARKTSKGDRVVNTNLFDIKQLYRSWTEGGHKIHATDDINETKLQLALLFSKDYVTYLNKNISTREIDYNNNLVACNGWSSFEELFHILNLTSKYVILRNFDNLDEQLTSKHPDVDLLVENQSEIINILNAKVTTKKPYRVQYYVLIKDKKINFDLRYIGDNYYCYRWEREILKTRVKYEYFYIPNKESHFYTLVYHALVHKRNISLDYIEKFHLLKKDLQMKTYINLNLLDYLLDYMDTKQYVLVEPNDITVGFNKPLIDTRVFIKISKRRMFHESYIGFRQLIKTILLKIKNKVIG